MVLGAITAALKIILDRAKRAVGAEKIGTNVEKVVDVNKGGEIDASISGFSNN